MDRISPTVGLNLAQIEYGGYRVVYWDLGGQKLLRGIWEKYYEECHGIMFVIDGSCEKRFDELKETFRILS
jgi:ADP-ribosylation factor related protein 1